MPETFNTRQTAVIASANKTIYWLFRVEDINDNVYYWSTGTQASGDGSIDIGALPSPGVYAGSEWEYAHTFKIINFNGITLRRSKSEYGINAPNDVSFTIVNGSNTLSASDFKGGTVRIALVVDDGSGKEVVGSWRFVIKSASPYNQQIDVTCEDFLQQYLIGSYPNTRLISEIFPANTNNTIIQDNMCVPEPYGTPYIPLRSIVNSLGVRYYLLGESSKTYTITEVRSPRAVGAKLSWTYPTYAMTQSTQTAPDATTWRCFQPIIASSVALGAVDSSGLWQNGDTFHDIPTYFSELSTVSMTNPADVFRRVLINMGVDDGDIDVDAAKLTFTSWGLTWNFAFYYQEDRAKVLSKLLTMCHSCLVIGEKITLQVLSKTSVKTITSVEVTKPSEDSPASFKYTDSLAERMSDSGYIAWQNPGESQDLLVKSLVPIGADYPDSETIDLIGVDSAVGGVNAQKLGILYYERKFGKVADISTVLKGTCLIIRPDDVVTVDDSGDFADFGGTYNALVDEVVIKPDASVDLKGIKFGSALRDWGDISASVVDVLTDSSTATVSPVYAGNDSPGLPNALPGRLRIGRTQNYIVLDPSDPLISLFSNPSPAIDTERLRIGNLNGFLDFVTDVYGFAGGSSTDYVKIDATNGTVTISGAIAAGTISIGTSPNWLRVDATGNLWLGADLFADAPFSVTPAGVLTATDATITGNFKTAASGERLEFLSADKKLHFYDSTGTETITIGDSSSGGYADAVWIRSSLTNTTGDWVGINVDRAGSFIVNTQDRYIYGGRTHAHGTNASGAYYVRNIGFQGQASGGTVGYNWGLYGLSTNGQGVRGVDLDSGYGVYGYSLNSYAVYSGGTTYLGGNTTIVTGAFFGLGSGKGRLTFTDAATDTAVFADCSVEVPSFKAAGAEQLKIWTYTHTVTAAEASSDTWSHTVTAVTLAKVRFLLSVLNSAMVGVTNGFGSSGSVVSTNMTGTTAVSGTCVGAAENEIISITIIEAV